MFLSFLVSMTQYFLNVRNSIGLLQHTKSFGDTPDIFSDCHEIKQVLKDKCNTVIFHKPTIRVMY